MNFINIKDLELYNINQYYVSGKYYIEIDYTPMHKSTYINIMSISRIEPYQFRLPEDTVSNTPRGSSNTVDFCIAADIRTKVVIDDAIYYSILTAEEIIDRLTK